MTSSTSSEMYIDGVGKIDFVGGVIRMELVSLEAEEGKKEPKIIVRQRLVMPARGLLQSVSVMQSMVQKMLDAGVIKTQEPDKASTDTSPKAAGSKK